MNVGVKILMTLLLAIATIVANATCVCARPTVGRATRSCCAPASRNDEHGRPVTGKCGRCHASAVAAGERDASPTDFVALTSIQPADVSVMFADAVERSKPTSLAAPPPVDVLQRRRVLQV